MKSVILLVAATTAWLGLKPLSLGQTQTLRRTTIPDRLSYGTNTIIQFLPTESGTNAGIGTKITVPKVNVDFLQNDGSCVLSSYAIVGNYYTGRPIGDYFEGYCKHFKLRYKDARDAEHKYAAHFDQEWRKRNCRGYQVILELHSNSTVACFAEARRRFDGRFYLDSDGHRQELEDLLSGNEAFLNITYEPGSGYHSITVFRDGSRLLSRDTNRKGLSPIPSLSQIGKLRDSVLYIAIAAPGPAHPADATPKTPGPPQETRH
jgi:hypothetical protein